MAGVSQDVQAEDKGPAIIISLTTATSISTLFVAARLFVRGKILGKIHWDDILIVVSIILGWIFTAITIAAVHHGDGKHTAALSDEQMSGALLYTMAGFVPGVMSFCIPKIAVVALLTRLLQPGKLHTIFLWSIVIISLLNLVINMVFLFVQCRPLAAMWDVHIPDKVCWDPQVMVNDAIWCGAFSAAVDLYLAIYPATVLWRLQISPRKKLGLSIALGFGSIAALVAIYKCTRLPGLGSRDFIYDTADLVIWTSIESSTLIIASCIPILQPLVDVATGKRTMSRRNTSAPSYNHNSRSRSRKSQPHVPNSHASDWSRQRGTTTVSSETRRDIEGGSQESILGYDTSSKETAVGIAMQGNIMKTHTFTISYDTDDSGGGDRPRRGPLR